jgi:hypothetical protein
MYVMNVDVLKALNGAEVLMARRRMLCFFNLLCIQCH